MTNLQAISLYEKTTGESVGDWLPKEQGVISSAVKAVRVSTSEAEAISAIGWLLTGNEDRVLQVVGQIQSAEEPPKVKHPQWSPPVEKEKV